MARAAGGTEKRRAGRSESGRQRADQSGRRQIGAVTRQQHPPAGGGMKASNRDQIDEIAEKDQAAAIVDSGEGQRQPARDEPDQRPEIALGAWPIDQRRAQDDEVEPGPLGRRDDAHPRSQAWCGHRDRRGGADRRRETALLAVSPHPSPGSSSSGRTALPEPPRRPAPTPLRLRPRPRRPRG